MSTKKTTAKLILNSENTRCFPPKINNKTEVSHVITPFEHGTGSPGYAINQEKEIKSVLIKKKLGFFAGNMIVYVENPEEINKKVLLQLINNLQGPYIPTTNKLKF